MSQETQKEIIFGKGFNFKRPHANAPDFVKGSMSVKVSEAIAFLQQYQKNDWVNLDLLTSRDNTKLYFKLNTFEAKTDVVNPVPANPAPVPQTDHRTHDRLPDYPEENIDPEDVPF